MCYNQIKILELTGYFMNQLLTALKKNLDPFTLSLVATVLLAITIPVRGSGYTLAALASKLVVALLFFLHGVKLSPQNLWLGLTHWRLHLVILVATFIMFPVFGSVLKPFLIWLSGEEFYLGILFICVLPSTVQSSIAFTSMAGGNVAAAVCSASASSLLGVIFTPLLVGLLYHTHIGGFSWQSVRDLCLQLLFPFLLGQFLRPCLIAFILRRKSLIGYTDRLSVLFIVYVSFSQATILGLWSRLNLSNFLSLIVSCGLLLTLALTLTSLVGLRLGFNLQDRIVILFCGSKKSLVAGVPMANILFPSSMAGIIILPLMLFHQMQLMVCAFIARKLSQKQKL
jgi:sodium/bile acid cotransporter 7